MLNGLHTAASKGRMVAASPFHQSESAVMPSRESQPAPDHPILVVDNDPEDLQSLSAMLQALNLPSIAARGGKEALQITASTKLSLVLMDIQMPVIDGCEAAQAIQRAAGREHLPIVAMTARVGLEDQRRCHEAGCVDFIAKPIDQSDLRLVVHRWLRRRRDSASSETDGLPASQRPSIAG
jgi:CheY-like chemotaxis protein